VKDWFGDVRKVFFYCHSGNQHSRVSQLKRFKHAAA
jgi:hypothetical protein